MRRVEAGPAHSLVPTVRPYANVVNGGFPVQPCRRDAAPKARETGPRWPGTVCCSWGSL